MRTNKSRHHASQDKAGLASGLTEKSKIDKDPASCGMGSVGKAQKPQANPKSKAPGGHRFG